VVVEEWLSGQNTHTLHKPVRKRFPRNPYTVQNIDDVCEVPFRNTTKNTNISYMSDIFARYAWSFPLKDKIGTSITALKYLFRDRKPITIQSDKDTEFVNTMSNRTLNVRTLIFIQLTILTLRVPLLNDLTEL